MPWPEAEITRYYSNLLYSKKAAGGFQRHFPNYTDAILFPEEGPGSWQNIKESHLGGLCHAAARRGEHLSSGQNSKLCTGYQRTTDEHFLLLAGEHL